MGYQFIMPKSIYSGDHALSESRGVIAGFGTHALIVTDQVMVKLGNVALVTDLLDTLSISYTIYDEINGEPVDTMIDKGLTIYKENQCDFLIAVGGGSPMDSMKAIAAMVTNPGNISDYLGKTIDLAVPPMVAVPTTAGTGSEATQFTIITDTKRDIKMLLKGAVLMPDLAIVDPQFTLTAPPSVTAATGLDALCHASEAFTSRKAQPLTDDMALAAIKRIFKYLPVAYHDGSNVEARKQMSIAALQAGTAFNNASVTLIHGMSRPIGALFHVPHGISNAMLIKECFTFALDGAYDRFGTLGRAIGAASDGDSDKEAAYKFLEAAAALCRECQIPTLEAYGIDKEKFFASIDKMAEDAMASGSPSNTIKDMTKEDVVRIYQNLWA